MSNIFYFSDLHPSRITNLAADRANLHSIRTENLDVGTSVEIPDGSLQIDTRGAGVSLTALPEAGALDSNAFQLRTLTAGTNVSFTTTDDNITIESADFTVPALGIIVTDAAGVSPPDPATVVVTGTSAVGAGQGTQVTGASAVGIGNNSVANATNAVAIGTLAAVTAASGVAVGNDSNVSAVNGIAIGDADVTGGNGVSIGNGATAALRSVAVGLSATAADTDGISVGHNATSGIQGIAIGKNSDAGDNSIAIGLGAQSTGNGSIDIGTNNVSTSSIAIGGANTITHPGVCMIGTGGTSTATNRLVHVVGGVVGFVGGDGVLIVRALPNSAAGLPSGSVWYDAGANNVLKYVP
jgi:hypothetical protein